MVTVVVDALLAVTPPREVARVQALLEPAYAAVGDHEKLSVQDATPSTLSCDMELVVPANLA